MKLRNRIQIMCITLIIASLLLSSNVMASEVSESVQSVALDIYYHVEDTILANVQFDIYQVAIIDDEDNIIPTEYFASYTEDIIKVIDATDEDLRELTTTLEQYVISENILPIDEGSTDEEGKLSFPTDSNNKLQKGLYLILGGSTTQNNYVYEATPFITMLPREDGVTTAIPKVVSRPLTGGDTPSGDTPDNPEDPGDTPMLLSGDFMIAPDGDYIDGSLEEAGEPETPSGMMLSGSFLPQTGQLWWPVPIMIAVGLIFIIIGLLRRRIITNEE